VTAARAALRQACYEGSDKSVRENSRREEGRTHRSREDGRGYKGRLFDGGDTSSRRFRLAGRESRNERMFEVFLQNRGVSNEESEKREDTARTNRSRWTEPVRVVYQRRRQLVLRIRRSRRSTQLENVHPFDVETPPEEKLSVGEADELEFEEGAVGQPPADGFAA
jgi:hypothetical protein